MKVPEFISRVRLLADRNEENPMIVIGCIRQADSEIFEKNGGLKNADFANVLKTFFQDTITPSKRDIVLPSEYSGKPDVMVGNVKCLLVNRISGNAISGSDHLLPAASISNRVITIYPESIAFDSAKSVSVTVEYVKKPSPVIYIGGLQVKIVDSSVYGIGNGFYIKATIETDNAGNFNQNELVGGYVSAQISGNTRADYRIEYHAAGELTTLYVNQTPQYVEVTDIGFESSRTENVYYGSVHKTSDLPSSYHSLIAERAAEILRTRSAEAKS